MANATDPPLGPPQGDCSCFYGTPVRNADGSCGCHDFTPATGGIKPAKNTAWVPGRGWVPYTSSVFVPPTVTPPPAAGMPAASIAADDGKIFGFSPMVVLGAAAFGLYVLSSMEGKK